MDRSTAISMPQCICFFVVMGSAMHISCVLDVGDRVECGRAEPLCLLLCILGWGFGITLLLRCEYLGMQRDSVS